MSERDKNIYRQAETETDKIDTKGQADRNRDRQIATQGQADRNRDRQIATQGQADRNRDRQNRHTGSGRQKQRQTK